MDQPLAHTIGNAVERANRRGDLFDKRRRLMVAWAEYCAGRGAAGEAGDPGDNVIPMTSEVAA